MTFTPTRADPPLQAVLWRDSGDPWRVLIATMLLNCTSRRQVDEVWPAVFATWPTALHLAGADDTLEDRLAPLGFRTQRPNRMREMSAAWHARHTYRPMGQGHHWPLDVRHLPGLGTYAQDSYRLFVCGHLDAGLWACDRVVRAWALLCDDKCLRLDHELRVWRRAPTRQDAVPLDTARPARRVITPRREKPSAPITREHRMSTVTVRMSAQLHQYVAENGTKALKDLAGEAQDQSRGKGSSKVIETTQAKAKTLGDWLTKQAAKDDTPADIKRRARTVAKRALAAEPKAEKPAKAASEPAPEPVAAEPESAPEGEPEIEDADVVEDEKAGA